MFFWQKNWNRKGGRDVIKIKAGGEERWSKILDSLPLWSVNFVWLPSAHKAALPFPKGQGVKNKVKKLMGHGKDGEITHQLLSQAKQTQIG